MDVERAGLAIALIVVLGLDTVACLGPIPYIRADFERLRVTPTEMKLIPVAKALAVLGLLVGLWMPWVGVLACIGMLIYFGFAFWYHDRVGDPFAKYLPAIGFAGFVAAALYLSYLPAA